LDIAHIHNYGISFGLFSGLIPSWVIVLIGSVITAFLIYMMITASNKIEKWGLTVIIAGALSNIVDRGMNNYVLDFIYLHYKDFYWPAFNFADIYITFGVLMILYQVLKEFKKKFIK
jgi:signal peptidase II